MADENIVRSYRSIGPARRPSEQMPARCVFIAKPYLPEQVLNAMHSFG